MCLKKVKRCCKVTYYVEKCKEFRNNSKRLWSMINNVIGKTSDKRCVISKLLVENVEQSNSSIIANNLAKHFADVGILYACRIAKSNTQVQEYLSKIPKNQSSLYLVPVTEYEIKKDIG